MEEGRRRSLVDYFENLEDPRVERSKRHSLLDIITIAICASSAGRTRGYMWRCSARARKSGSAPFWTYPTASPPMIPPPSRGQALR